MNDQKLHLSVSCPRLSSFLLGTISRQRREEKYTFTKMPKLLPALDHRAGLWKSRKPITYEVIRLYGQELCARKYRWRMLRSDQSGGGVQRNQHWPTLPAHPSGARTVRSSTHHQRALGRLWGSNKLACLAKVLARVMINWCEICPPRV